MENKAAQFTTAISLIEHNRYSFDGEQSGAIHKPLGLIEMIENKAVPFTTARFDGEESGALHNH